MTKKFEQKYDNVFQNKKLTGKKKEIKVEEQKFKNNSFHTFFGLPLTVEDIMQDENIIVKSLEKLKMIHSREKGGCGFKISIKFSENVYRFWCNCGMLLIYPPREDRDNALLIKWFPKKKI